MKLPVVIAIAALVVVASLAKIDAVPTLVRRGMSGHDHIN
jgi:hypothetical protein